MVSDCNPTDYGGDWQRNQLNGRKALGIERAKGAKIEWLFLTAVAFVLKLGPSSAMNI
jgi:hypothetical protein